MRCWNQMEQSYQGRYGWKIVFTLKLDIKEENNCLIDLIISFS